jgi:hypothetical protein
MDWPKPGEKLFRTESEHSQFSACIDCYHRSLQDMAADYKEGADALARAAANGDAYLDRLISPIVFLYRQYLELAVKGIIATARCLEGERPGYPITHNLHQLWHEAARLMRKHYGDEAPPEMDYIQPCIDDFNKHDPDSFAFRYPTDKKGRASLRGITNIDLQNLHDTMQRLSSFLECIGSHLADRLQSKMDCESEYRG